MKQFLIRVNVLVYLIFILIFYCISSSQAIQSFSYKWTTIIDHKQYSLDKVLTFKQEKPYIYRILVPYVINFIVNNIPQQLIEPIYNRSKNTLKEIIGDDTNKFDKKFILSYGIILIFNFVLLVITLFLLRELSREVFKEKNNFYLFIIDVCPVLFALMLSISYRVYNGFIYDQFELFILTSYLLLAWRRKWIFLIFPILAIAILNKETAIFYPIIGLAIYCTSGKKTYGAKNAFFLFMEFLVVIFGFCIIHYIYRNFPGGNIEFHFLGNIKFWLSPISYISMTTPHLQLIALPKPSNIIILIPILISIFAYWNSKPLTLRVCLIVVMCINLPLFIFLSYRDEFRNLSLAFPLMYLSVLHSIIVYTGALTYRNN